MGGFEPLGALEESVARAIVDAACKVHRSLGPGLLEKVYEACFCHELRKHGYSARQQVSIGITYDGLRFEDGLRIDVVVEDIVVCELKAVTELHPVFRAQLLSYLRLSGKR